MECKHELKDKLGELARGTLPEPQLRELLAHLQRCKECSEELEQIRQLLPALKKVSESHIPAEILVDYAQVQLGKGKPLALAWDREEVAGHLEICDTCLAELETLLELESALQTEETSGQEVRTYGLSFSWLDRLLENISTAASGPKLKFAFGTVAVLFFLALPIWILNKPEKSNLPILALLEVDRFGSSTFSEEIQTRSPLSEAEIVSFAEPQEAATNEFLTRLKRIDGEYQFTSTQQQNRSGKTVLIRLIDHQGKTLAEFSRFVEQGGEDGSTKGRIQAWILALPSQVLFQVEMTVDSAQVLWNLGANQICVTFTYEMERGYRAVPAQWKDFSPLN